MRMTARFTMRRLAIALLATVLAATGCAGAAPPATPASSPAPAAAPPTRDAVLISLTDTVIVPRYREAATAMNQLRAALDTLCAAPTGPSADALADARTAWRAARAPWMRTQATWFGPVMERRTRSLVDWAPVDPQRIEKTLAARNAIAVTDVPEFLGASQRGLGAMEYILFGDGDGTDDAAVLTALGGADTIRCQYLTALGAAAAAELDGVLADWTGNNPEGKSYAGFFNGTASSSLLAKAAVDELVRSSVFLTRSMADQRLAPALDPALDADGGSPEPAALYTGPGHNTAADLRNQALGMQDIYLGGATGPGLSGLIRGLSPPADDRMRASFAAMLTALDNLTEPLPATIRDNPEPARRAHQKVQDFRMVLNTEVVSLLGVSVGFADTDGDGG